MQLECRRSLSSSSWVTPGDSPRPTPRRSRIFAGKQLRSWKILFCPIRRSPLKAMTQHGTSSDSLGQFPTGWIGTHRHESEFMCTRLPAASLGHRNGNSAMPAFVAGGIRTPILGVLRVGVSNSRFTAKDFRALETFGIWFATYRTDGVTCSIRDDL